MMTVTVRRRFSTEQAAAVAAEIGLDLARAPFDVSSSGAAWRWSSSTGVAIARRT